MIKPGSIAFDIDGVVADTMSLFLEIGRDDYGIRHIGYDDITDYNLDECLDMDPDIIGEIVVKITDGSHSQALNPIQGAMETLGKIGARVGSLTFVTARPHLGPLEDWLCRGISMTRDSMDIVATGSFDDKADALLSRGKSFFVEDRLETCFLLKEAGIEPILFRQPWNRREHPFVAVDVWSELEELIDFS